MLESFLELDNGGQLKLAKNRGGGTTSSQLHWTLFEKYHNSKRSLHNLSFSIHQAVTRSREEILWAGERNGATEGGNAGLESFKGDRQGISTPAELSHHHHQHNLPPLQPPVPLCFTLYCVLLRYDTMRAMTQWRPQSWNDIYYILWKCLGDFITMKMLN